MKKKKIVQKTSISWDGNISNHLSVRDYLLNLSAGITYKHDRALISYVGVHDCLEIEYERNNRRGRNVILV